MIWNSQAKRFPCPIDTTVWSKIVPLASVNNILDHIITNFQKPPYSLYVIFKRFAAMQLIGVALSQLSLACHL